MSKLLPTYAGVERPLLDASLAVDASSEADIKSGKSSALGMTMSARSRSVSLALLSCAWWV